jgi:uncharacterized protein
VSGHKDANKKGGSVGLPGKEPVMASEYETPFWIRKSLSEMTADEWESLCDGCGKCCLVKLEDVDTGDLLQTRIGCRLLDTSSCKCTNYPERQRHVPDCVQLTPENVRELPWIPASCAYKKLANGEPLEWWHPLVSGDPDTVRQAGISAAGRIVSEDDVDDAIIENYIVEEEDGFS